MKALMFSLTALMLISCATQKPAQVEAGREPNQYRGDRRDGPRRDDPYRDGPNRPGPRNDDRYGRNDNRDWRGGMRGSRRCVRCFDTSRFNDVVTVGQEVDVYGDQYSGPREYEQSLFRPVCGIRSVSIEVLDNEAQISGLEVHYEGDSYFNWDRIPLQRDWDFRNGSAEGENSMWFDVGDARRGDRVCIDRIKVRGYTYKDNFDFGDAKVQMYGSRSLRGVVGGRPNGPSYPVPGPGPMPIPTPAPQPVTIQENYPGNPILLRAPYDCMKTLPAPQNADDLFENDLCIGKCGSLVKYCGNARDKTEIRRIEAQGWSCTTDSLNNVGKTDFACVDELTKRVPPMNAKGEPNKVKDGHRRGFTQFCSEQVWMCSRMRTIYR